MILLAKSAENGGTPLREHLLHVAYAAETFASRLGLEQNEISICKTAGLLHDIGKAHPLFQLRLQGRKPDPTEMPLRHEISSLLFLSMAPRQDWEKLVEYVVAHHKSVGLPQAETFGNKGLVYLANQYGQDETFEWHRGRWEDWSPVACQMLKELGFGGGLVLENEARSNFDFALRWCESKIGRHSGDWSWRRGLLMGADHLASGIADSVYEISSRLFKTPDISFFSSRKNDLYPLSQLHSDDPRPHTLVRAPTGSGKTDYLMRRTRGRIFYTLPFQASINSMFDRFCQAMPNDEVRCLHAASRLKVDTKEERVLQGLPGSSVKVLTPHQLAAVITGIRGFEAIALDLKGCDVILDEIHCYSEEAQAMVLELVRVLKLLDCRIHIGTATMPSCLEKLVFQLLGGESEVNRIDLSDEILSTFDRHLMNLHTSLDETISIAREAVNNGEKVLIVCNRVNSAQHLYTSVRDSISAPVFLIHSRFRRLDRKDKEAELARLFSQDDGCLVVATQVIEVSLDISADRMITECAPLDSLIQRFGRVNRKRTINSIGKVRPVHVVTPPKVKREALPYNLEILERTFNQLGDKVVLRECELGEKLDAVYPEVKVLQRDVHFAWKNETLAIPYLCHLPKHHLMELLNIESQTLILKSDEKNYLQSSSEERIKFEIPVPRSSTYRSFASFGRLECGSNPIVVHDDLYSRDLGFCFQELDNFL